MGSFHKGFISRDFLPLVFVGFFFWLFTESIVFVIIFFIFIVIVSVDVMMRGVGIEDVVVWTAVGRWSPWRLLVSSAFCHGEEEKKYPCSSRS